MDQGLREYLYINEYFVNQHWDVGQCTMDNWDR